METETVKISIERYDRLKTIESNAEGLNARKVFILQTYKDSSCGRQYKHIITSDEAIIKLKDQIDSVNQVNSNFYNERYRKEDEIKSLEKWKVLFWVVTFALAVAIGDILILSFSK